jgi:succinyl-diaminopimelate desuccinylase
MKSGVASMIYTLKQIKDFDGILSILLTSDEEGDAKNGTIKMLEHLKKINFLPDYCLVGEPTSNKIFGDSIKIGRRGSINGIIKIQGTQAHAAYPQMADNPIDKIAPVLSYIAGVKLDDGDDMFEPSKMVITDIRAGLEVTNVTPSELKLMFNVRNSTKTNQDNILNFLRKYLTKDTTITMTASAYPFITDKNSKIVLNLIRSIKKLTNITPKLSTSGGTSDARFIAQFGIDVVEFGVINDMIHKVNENTNIDYVIKLSQIYLDLIKNFRLKE